MHLSGNYRFILLTANFCPVVNPDTMVCLQEARELFKDPEVEAADKVEVGCQI